MLLTRNKDADAAARLYFLTHLGAEDGMTLCMKIADIDNIIHREELTTAIIRDMETWRKHGTVEDSHVRKVLDHREVGAVDVRTFVEDPYFLDAKGILYPKVMDALIEMNNGEYQETVLTGAIGTGKTTLALYSTGYQLYLLSCYKNPHASFGLDPSSEIMFVFQSLNKNLAKSVDYERFKTMITKSPYFMENFPYDPGLLSELKFPNRIIVKPLSGSESGAIGQNVIGGVIDEMNFMALVEKSKSSADGGTYDQAIALYNSIARRRKSRFMSGGRLPGLLCLVSSKRYPGQFTDRKEEEAKRELDRTGKTSIYVYDKRTWDIKPADAFSGKWFNLFVGDEGRKPRILGPDEEVKADDMHLVMPIPEEYREEFESDMMGAIRDVAGLSTLATHPFIQDREAISSAVRTTNIIFGRDAVDFAATKLTIDIKNAIDLTKPRFAHIDLAISGDSAGFAIGHVRGFKKIKMGDTIEMMPDIFIDAVLEVAPPKGGEIMFWKIREVLYALQKLGMNVKWCTLDSFQSKDTMQLLKQAGIATGLQSMDTSTAPYDFTKNALYQGRMSLPKHVRLERELSSLERDVKKNKIDHPPHGSKDVSDAVAGVVYGLTMRKETWFAYGIPLGSIPDSVRETLVKKDKKEQPNE